MTKRWKIESWKVPGYENQKIVSFVDLLEEIDSNKSHILVFIEELQIKSLVPRSSIIDGLLQKMEEHWENFYDTFRERSQMDDEEASEHADFMLKDIYPQEYEILKKDYPEKYK